MNAPTENKDEKEAEEATDFELQGWKPYLFYFRTSGWHRVAIAMVSSRFVFDDERTLTKELI